MTHQRLDALDGESPTPSVASETERDAIERVLCRRLRAGDLALFLPVFGIASDGFEQQLVLRNVGLKRAARVDFLALDRRCNDAAMQHEQRAAPRPSTASADA